LQEEARGKGEAEREGELPEPDFNREITRMDAKFERQSPERMMVWVAGKRAGIDLLQTLNPCLHVPGFRVHSRDFAVDLE
jgi:hypothetical protein